MTLDGLRSAYQAGGLTVAAMVEALLERLRQTDGDNVWISRVAADALRDRAKALDALRAKDAGVLGRMPLFGVPFAVKDNIDAAGLPTTAACPAFSYTPKTDSTAVARLIEAGALMVGKTNLDQFATGLVGVRSPYGIPKNPFNARYIPGGSSSGSAVAVANGTVAFSLGTDTAGSGRVPAGFNGLVGLKPTKGLVSTTGVVPACRSLDCVSVFANNVSDAEAVFEVIAAFDETDPFARPAQAPRALPPKFRLGIPRKSDFVDCGDPNTRPLFDQALARLVALGAEPVEIPLALFHAAADLLYSGPWLAERLASIEPFLRAHGDDVLPVTRAIIEGGAKMSAADAFRGIHALAGLRREVDALWRDIDLLVTPTTPTIYTIAEIEAEPVKLNMALGTYTNFVNLLDMAALALPAGLRADGLPFGITLFGPAFSDARLAALGLRFEQGPAGDAPARNPAAVAPSDPFVLAVFGAHLSGMALNGELTDLGGTLLRPVKTAPHYRQFLIEGKVPRPGMLRTSNGHGGAIEAELWSLPEAGFARFVAGTLAPLGIGTIELDDGSRVKGFLCESWATETALDITKFGGWRRFIESGRLKS